jgi:CRP/FNR family transcriptional regulator, cyclic AMP receptor protein
MTIRTSFDPELTKKIVRTIPIFDNFTDQELSALLERTRVYKCRKGETIFLDDDQNQLMYIILKGRVKVVETTAEGLERVMAFRQRGDYFGEMGLLDGKTDSATIIAMEPCHMLLLTKSLFDEFFLENNRALQGIIAVLCRRLRESWVFHNIIGFKDAESKIRATLARYGKTLGIRDSSGVIINSTLSHQSIADRVQITRETATRALKRMKDQQEIEILAGRRIKLLPAFFEKYAQIEMCKSLKID